jgi:hypothetical protein
MNIISNIFSPYFGMQKIDFRPLTYIEVEQGKELIVRLDDKYAFKTKLQIADNFIKFNTSKDIILKQLDRLNELKSDDRKVYEAKIQCYKVLIRLLYEISKDNYKGFFAKRKYYKYLNKLFLNDIKLMTNVFQSVLDYNTDLKKKLKKLQNTKIFKSSVSDMTTGGQSLQDLIEIDPNTGEKRFKH